MTGDDGEVDEDTEGDVSGGSAVPSSKTTADSRFDKFLEQFDDPAVARERSVDRPTETKTRRKEETPETETNSKSAGPDVDPEGWIWGTPNGTPGSATDAGGWVWIDTNTPSSDDQTDRYEHSGDDQTLDPSDARFDQQTETQPPESVDERIWNMDFEEGLNAPEANREAPESPSNSPAEKTSSTSIEAPEESDTRDEKPDVERHPEDGDRADSTQRDRWSELGSSLRVDEGVAGEPIADSQTETTGQATPDSEQGALDRATQPRSWDTTDETALSIGDEHEEASLLDNNRSRELDRIADDSSVLVLGPRDHPISDAICSRFLVGESGPRDVLFVTFEGPPSDRIELCNSADGWEGGEIGIVKIGRKSRDSATSSETTTSPGGGSITVRHVAKPGDLSKLGIVISQLLSKLERTPRETILCFDSLSALHTQTGTKTLFRFLNTLQGRLRSAGAVGHYHMDPDLHDEIVIETLRPLFDSIVRYSADGELEIE